MGCLLEERSDCGIGERQPEPFALPVGLALGSFVDAVKYGIGVFVRHGLVIPIGFALRPVRDSILVAVPVVFPFGVTIVIPLGVAVQFEIGFRFVIGKRIMR